ncbi:MAG: tRNA-dihydrouridine synthase [Candidatus Micrarchaeota archaeon]|nr:tRNA-dihydrouridine synthase [Candidatus Micrarchaeota archaeon]
MRYGNADLQGKFVLGPMADYSDIAFRLLCRKRGAAMCFTPFANAAAIVRGIPATLQIMKTCKEEMPVGIQIFGSDEKIMAEACRIIDQKVACGELFASCIDINFGCPSGTVTRAGAGAALLKNPQKIAGIVSACASASQLPITAKIRAGWASDNSMEIARAIERGGAVGITVHWRTATEGRKRSCGWAVVGEVKRSVGIPVIGNGGATTPEKAVQFLQEAGCDAVMVSSGALGNPSIFKRANWLLSGRLPEPAGWNEKLEDFQEYVRLAEKHGILSPKPLRSHAIKFLSGFRGVKKARQQLNLANGVEEIIAIVEGFTPAPHL